VRAAGLEVEPGHYAVLAVSDTGVGMDAELRAHIFEPFFTTKDSSKGTGLGLSTVHDIVRAAGGAVEVESEPGRGTTFRVLLPATAPGAEAAAERAGRTPEGGTERVLLVEDDEQVRAAVRRVLSARGYQVVEARTGDAAVRAAVELSDRQLPLHLLVSDLILPGDDGRMTAARLRVLNPHLRVVYMSGHTDHPALEEDLPSEPGVTFLAKPFSVDQLADAVRAALGS
jgi:hypothetical protein